MGDTSPRLPAADRTVWNWDFVLMNPRNLLIAGAVVVTLGIAIYAFSANSTDSRSPTISGATESARGASNAKIAPLTPPAATSAPAAPPAAPPAEKAPVVPPALAGTKIEPGTPPQFWKPYLEGYVPVEIKKDGTQIYKNIPQLHVKQPDGSMKTQLMDLEVKPTPAVPINPEEAAGG